MVMTPQAKSALAKAVRELRGRLLRDLHEETEAFYRLSIPVAEAKLDEATQAHRHCLESWVAKHDSRQAQAVRENAEKRAGYTLLHRLVMLRLMETPRGGGKALRTPAILTGGWDSPGYKYFRQIAPALVQADETEGYRYLLNLAFEDVATQLPAVFGPAGIADLIAVSAATLRHAVEVLDQPELESCWSDDMTLGWVYQFWNDPEREALDRAVKQRHRIQRHEIASKTQMFTDRYIVDWLLQNSLAPMWLAICKKHGWSAESTVTIAEMQERREHWRSGRARGEIEATEPLALHSSAERWAFYVPKPISDAAAKQAPQSLRDLRILDPAVGSGHFLVVALELLVSYYQEEARHRERAGEPCWSDDAIVESILANNLHGIDLDPRAAQIAAAALWLKARDIAPRARPTRINIVSSNLRLGSLADDDSAWNKLRHDLARDIGLAPDLTDAIVHELGTADHLGSLLKSEALIDAALNKHEEALARSSVPRRDGRNQLRQVLLARLEEFLRAHSSAQDLGVRLQEEQLAAGVRLLRMLQVDTYDLVVANPPYHSAGKLAADATTYQALYPTGRADLCSAFMLRSLELLKPGGISATVTLSNWMYLRAFSEFRAQVLDKYSLEMLADLGKGSFSAGSNLISASAQIFRRAEPTHESVAFRVYDPEGNAVDGGRVTRNRVALLGQVGRHDFDAGALNVVSQWPVVYDWEPQFLAAYAAATKIGDQGGAQKGIDTGSNAQYVRRPWEIHVSPAQDLRNARWVPYIMGAQGLRWFEPLQNVVRWDFGGFEIRHRAELHSGTTIRNAKMFGQIGIAYSTIGSNFAARKHRYPSICDNGGTSVYSENLDAALCVLNSKRTKRVLASLNPTVNFQAGDVNRVPLPAFVGARAIVAQLEESFRLHEMRREPSVEFRKPGPCPWQSAQAWAKQAIECPEPAERPEYQRVFAPEAPTDHLSFALGVVLGRFHADGSGVVDPATSKLSGSRETGILFLDTTLDAQDWRDGLGQDAASLHAAWESYGAAIGTTRSLREWLAFDFFKAVHLPMYEHRPIHWPLSSQKRSFVAWVNIHRLNERTLHLLLADHLHPALKRIDGELTDLLAAREENSNLNREAGQRHEEMRKARDELAVFIEDIAQCADRGPLPTDAKCPEREQDARYEPNIEDGVMINSAALWKLLEPQWKDPKKWWKELACGAGKKDHDWSHLAMRYWPTRVDHKCKQDASLAVAHGCLWRYHPERAWAWELRLQGEIDAEFRIVQAPYRPGGRDLGDHGDQAHRRTWLAEHAQQALAAVEREAIRRMGRGKERKILHELVIRVSGLWSSIPDEVRAMEARLAQKQQTDFYLRAPDEAQARIQAEVKSSICG